MKDNTELFETMSVPRAVRTMAIPTVLGQLIVLIYNMADTFFIGQTDNKYMVAAASLILPVFNITLSLAGLAGIGGGALVSRLLGVKRPDEARRVYSFSVYLCIIISALFSLGVLIFMRPLMYLLGANENTFAYAHDYAMCVIVFGAIPTVLSGTLAAFLRSVGESRKAGFGVTMGGVINIALDPLFMFVLLPAGREVVGAGVATCLSNCLSCLYFILVICRLPDRGVLRLCSPAKLPERASVAGIFAVGLPSSITTLLFDLDYVVIDKLMTAYGDAAVAGVGIVLKAERLPLNVGVGLCQAMVPITAYNYASGNMKRMNDVRRHVLLLGLAVAAGSIVLYESLAGIIMRTFIRDAETVALGTNFLRIRCLATPLMFLSFFHVNLFNSFGEGGRAMFLGIVRWAALNIPMLFLLNAWIGMYGLVWTQAIADGINVVLSFAVYRQFEKKSGLREKLRNG